MMGCSLLAAQLRVILRCTQMVADKRRRVFYAITNIITLLLTVLFIWLTVSIFKGMNAQTAYEAGEKAGGVFMGLFTSFWGIIGGVVLAIVCIVFAVYCFFAGGLCQLVLFVASLIGLCKKSEAELRTVNAVAFVICLISIVGAIVGAVMLLRYV